MKDSVAPAEVETEGAAPLRAYRHVALDAVAFCTALAEPAWLGHPVEGPAGRPDLRRYETDLAFSLRADGRTLTFRRAALVDVGPLSLTDDGCAAEIAWRAAALAPLFPVFVGRLLVRVSSLELDGLYDPPGGHVGLLIDRAFLHYFAARTADWFLDQLVARATIPLP